MRTWPLLPFCRCGHSTVYRRNEMTHYHKFTGRQVWSGVWSWMWLFGEAQGARGACVRNVFLTRCSTTRCRYIGNWVTMFVCLISFLINLWNGGNCVKLCGRTAVWFWGQSDSRSKYWLEEDDSVTFVLGYNMSGTRNRNKTVQWKQKYSFQSTSAHWTKCTMEDEGSRNTQARGSYSGRMAFCWRGYSIIQPQTCQGASQKVDSEVERGVPVIQWRTCDRESMWVCIAIRPVAIKE